MNIGKIKDNVAFFIAAIFTILFDIGFIFIDIELIKRIAEGHLTAWWFGIINAICLVVLGVFNVEILKGFKELLKK